MAGTSTSLDASERVALRVGGSAKCRTAVSPKSDGGMQSPAEREEVESSASVELGDWGVRVSPRWLEKPFCITAMSLLRKQVYLCGI